MDKLKENLRALGKTRLMVLGGVGAGVLALALVLGTVLSRPAMSPLFSGLDPAESAQVVRVIEQMDVPYDMGGDGTAIYIPRADFSRVRMALAENGLPSRGGVGYEIFDESNSLGMTSFMQKVNRLRALEGELARTIQSVQGIEAARVHLVLPDREAFSREAPDPSASVVIRTRSGFSLERAQALAIRHLVSSSVPNLRSGAITVMDSSGTLLLAEESGEKQEVGAEGLRTAIEARIARNIENLLAPRVGVGNVRVQVSADLDMTKEVVRSQRFNPDEQVVRSTQMVEEESAEESSDANVSVEQNLPETGMGGESGSRSNRARTEETVNYEISNTVVESVVEPGRIRRISVAVLVNGVHTTQDGEPVYQDRDPQELERVDQLVRSAMGFDAERGDSVTVESLQFMDYALDVGEPVGIDFAAILAENMMDILRWLFVLIALALAVFGLRPVILRLLPREEQAAATAGGADDADDATQLALTSETAAPAAEGIEGDGGDEETVSIEQVKGDIQLGKIQKLTELVEKNPDQAVKVMKAWIARE